MKTRTIVLIVSIIVAFGVAVIVVFTTANRGEQDESNSPATVGDPQADTTSEMEIRLTDGTKVVTAVLDDTVAGRDFYSLLPTTIDLEDYSGSATIGYPDRKLDVQDMPTGVTPATGAFTYYPPPYGDIAIFYTDFGPVEGLVTLGVITEGLELVDDLAGPVTFKASTAGP